MDSNSSSESPHKPAPRFQFSLQHVFALFLALGVFLALVTQLRHIGFFAFLFLAGMGAGWWLRRQRLLTASMTALLVFVATYLASWAQMGFPLFMYGHQGDWPNYGSLERIAEELTEYAKAHGEFPDSLSQLPEIDSRGIRLNELGDPVDYWNHPFHYRKTAKGFELASLGRDGKPGGVGLDTDSFLGEEWNAAKKRLPLRHFLLDTPGSIGVFWAALVASACAGGIWFAAHKRNNVPAKWLVAGVTVTTIFAVIVAVFLAAVYVSLTLAVLEDHH